MEPQIGDVYFDTRARLSSAITSLANLAGQLDIHPSHVSLLQNLLANLKEPFLFVVVGEVNAGKSTLLNAIFGADFCEVGVIPTTARINLFKHGPERRDIEVGDTLVELYRQDEFLKDFNIVDTPGTNSIEDDHQEITERFIPMADLVIFSFSVANPWAASAWNLLQKIHKRWYKNITFALTQCDLRNPEEIDAIEEHLQVTAMQKLGMRFPTFMVSGKKAFLSKTSALDKERLWEESGFQEFEGYINEVVNSPEIRVSKLGNVSRSARVVLSEVQEQLATGARILQADEELLSGLGNEVRKQRQRTIEKFPPLLKSLDSDYMEFSMTGTARLQDRMGPGSGVFGKNDVPETIEQTMTDGMTRSAKHYADDATRIVEDDLQHLWRQLAGKMQDHFNFKLRVGSETGEPDWTAQKNHMREKIAKTVAEKMPELELNKLLRGRLIRRRLTGLFFLLTALTASIGGGALILLGKIPNDNLVAFSIIAASIVVAALILSSIATQVSSKDAVRVLGERFEQQRDSLDAALRAVLEEEAGGFFEDFLALFKPLHQLCEEHRQEYQPHVTELENLVRSFEEIDLVIGLDPLPQPEEKVSPIPVERPAAVL